MENQLMETEEIKVQQNKKKFGNRIKENLTNIINKVFYRYPITMITIILTVIASAILIDSEGLELLSKAAVFGAVFAAGSLMTEQYFVKKWILKCIGWIISGGVAGMWVLLAFQNPQASIFGDSFEYIYSYSIRLLSCYFVTTILLSLYGMYRNSALSFQEYCLNVFCTFSRTTLVYGIFAIGIASIIYAFNVLIFDTDEISLIFRIEVVLAGGIYVPGIILSFSDIKEKLSRFAHIVVNYVLMGLLMCAFVIIYLYLMKILIQWNIPSNESFSILSSVFIMGLPIWTIVASDKEHWYGKIATFLPLAFSPMIVLQGICIMKRIFEYGVTPSRYAAVAFLLFEIIYIILNYVRKGKTIAGMIFAIIFITWVCVAIPGINMYAASVYSQAAKLSAFNLDNLEDLSDAERQECYELYNVISNLNVEGEQYLCKYYPNIDSHSLYHSWMYDENNQNEQNYFFNPHHELNEMNISGYQTVIQMQHVHCSEGELLEDWHEICFVTDSGKEYYIDLSDFISAVIENRESIESDQTFLDEHNPILQPDGNAFYFSDIDFEIDKEGNIENFDVIGYLMEK